MSKAAGLRHILTGVENQRGTESGFQTVAYSKELSQLVPEIQSLVDGFSAPDGNEPSCCQLLKVPRTSAYALTTFTPLGPMPDGRPGNYWAETIMVPGGWLESAGWDTAVAFSALEWLGPGDVARTPEELAPVELPNLEPGPIDRLAILAEIVPPDQLVPLLRAVIHQSVGLKPLRILATSKTSHEALENLVMCLPLLVHPSLRTYVDGGERRCLTFRTWSPARPMTPAADLTGFPERAYEQLTMDPADLIDLGGSISPPKATDRGGEAYVAWLKRLILQERWDELEATYREVMPDRREVWYSSFRQRLSSAPVISANSEREDSRRQIKQPAAKVPSGPGKVATVDASEPAVEQPRGEAHPSPRVVREKIGEARDEAEGKAWQILETHRLGLQAKLDEYEESMGEAVKEATAALETVHGAHVAGVKACAAEISVARERQDSLESTFSQRLDQLARGLEDLRRHVNQLSEQEPGTYTPSEQPEIGVAMKVPEPWPRRVFSGRWIGRVQEDLGSWFRFRGAESAQKVRWGRVLPAVAVPLVALLATYAYLAYRSGPETTSDGKIVASAAEKKREARRRKLIEDLQTTATASALLATVRESQGYKERAEELALMVTLGQFQMTPAGEAALLQKALGASSVDGDWGGGSRRLLKQGLGTCEQCIPAASRAEPGQELLIWNGVAAHCFLRNYLELAVEPCQEVSPWKAQRSWTEEEAGRALALFRATGDAAIDSQLKQYLMAFDPARGTTIKDALGQTELLSVQHATCFLDLAYSWAMRSPDASFPESPSDGQFEKVEEVIAAIESQEGGN